MSIDGHICLGIDVGTSTCQAYGGTSSTLQPLFAEDVFVRDDFPSLVLELPAGARLFGFEARHAAGHGAAGVLHEHFKAYMRADHPLPTRYSEPEAVRLFGACAENFAAKVLPKLLDFVEHLENPAVDVAWTMPAGWRKDPRLERIYQTEVDRLCSALAGRHKGLSVHAYMIEEPVAALMSLGSKLDKCPEGVPILTVDAGGGTLDVAVCSYRKSGGSREFEVEFTDSSGYAGAALLHEFVAVLRGFGAFRPALPDDWARQAALRTSIEELFRRYHAPGRPDDVAEELRPLNAATPAVACTFSRQQVDAALYASRTVASQKAFLQSILEKFNRRVPEERRALAWRHVRAFGGLVLHPVFKRLLQEVLPTVVIAEAPALAIAHGAALHARQGGRLIAGRRTEFHLSQRLYEDSNSDRQKFFVVVPRGTMIGRDKAAEFTGGSQARRPSSGTSYTYLAWTNGEDLADDRGKVFDGTVDFGVPIERKDSFITTIRFDDLLRIEVEQVHARSKSRRRLASNLAWE